MSLTLLSFILGVLLILSGAVVFAFPTMVKDMLRAFPRCLPAGYVLIAISTAWFLYYFWQENVSDYAAYKNHLLLFFIVVAVGVCVYVKDFLGARGLAVLMMLAAKLVYDTARYADSSLAVIFPCIATLWIIGGFTFTVAPHCMRDLFNWVTARNWVFKGLAGIRLVVGIFLIILGFMGIH